MGKAKLKEQKLSKKLDSSNAIAKPEKKLKKKKKKISASDSKSKSKSKSKVLDPSTASSSSDPESDSELETSASSGSETDSASGNVRQILEPYSKEQLIDLIAEAALSDSTLLGKIKEIADKDVAHRKIFVHGLSWDSTDEDVLAEFKKYGEVESCNVILDRNTGKAKGYAFVTFTSRKSATKALKEPRKELKNRVVVCHLAALGPSQGGQQDGSSVSGRKIYVSNVTSDVNAEKLRSFFAKFGEIESGPTGFDPNTGKFRGYALFMFKSVEGAKKALEEPNKVFDGRQLQCQKATEGKKFAGGAAGITTSVQPVPPVLATMATPNMPMLAQNPNLGANTGMLSLNPFYGGFLASPNPTSGFLSVSPLGGLGQVAGGGMGMGMGVGGYGAMLGSHGFSGLGSGNSAPGLISGTASNGTAQLGLQQTFPNNSFGKRYSLAQPSGTAGQSSNLR